MIQTIKNGLRNIKNIGRQRIQHICRELSFAFLRTTLEKNNRRKHKSNKRN